MKLEPKAKPVRIRIKSGGEEHFSLESLKKNFSVDDLWEAVIGKSLSRWLKNQNENDLADKVDAFCEIQKPTEEQYVQFSKLFFEDDSIISPDSLIDYYRNKGLEKNCHYAYTNLFHCLSYKHGKTCFNKYKNLRNTEDWISYFEKQLYQINDIHEKEDCLNLLITLCKDHNDKEKVKYLQDESIKLKLETVGGFEDLLSSGEYDTIKMLYDNPDIKNKKDSSYWITAFGRCQKSLTGNEKGQCLFILYKLFEEKGNKDLAKTYLKKSADCGYKEANDVLAKQSRYPELEDFLKQHPMLKAQMLDDIAAKWYQEYDKQSEHANYYKTCYDCLIMAADIVLNIGHMYNTVRDIKDRRYRLMKKHPEYKDLIFIIGALAYEEKYDNAALFSDSPNVSLSFDFKVFAKAKIDGKGIIVMAENNQKCNTQTASPVQQMFYIMRTYGCNYAFDY